MAGKPTKEKTERRCRAEIERLVEERPDAATLAAARKVDPTVTTETPKEALKKIVVNAILDRTPI